MNKGGKLSIYIHINDGLPANYHYGRRLSFVKCVPDSRKQNSAL